MNDTKLTHKTLSGAVHIAPLIVFRNYLNWRYLRRPASVVEREIALHIPVIDQAKQAEGISTRDAFIWDPENDRYICPKGHDLK
jgi:hypothetical protein